MTPRTSQIRRWRKGAALHLRLRDLTGTLVVVTGGGRGIGRAAAQAFSAAGAIVVVDNIARMGRVLDPADDDHQAKAVRAMFDMIGEHPRLDAAAIQTVGTKNWDGFAVALIT